MDDKIADEAQYQASQEDLAREYFPNLDICALAARASQLRQGISCSIPPYKDDSETRNLNYHVKIQFTDGVNWLARLRRPHTIFSTREFWDYIVRSEVATLKFLEQTGVPTPKVYDFAFENEDNPVGVGYILYEELPGEALNWADATPEQRKKVMDQLADIFIEIQKFPLDSSGSLDQPGASSIGPIASEEMVDMVDSQVRTIGPCASFQQVRTAYLQQILDAVVRGDLFRENSVDAYLMHRYLLDLVPMVTPAEPASDRKFYLKHGEDKGDHILVDRDHRITGIIDWEWTYTAPDFVAFSSPIGLLPVADFFDGVNETGDDELVFAQLFEDKRHDDLAYIVRAGRLQHRFRFACSYPEDRWKEKLILFQAFRKIAVVDVELDWEAVKAAALQKYKDDEGLQSLMSKAPAGIDGPSTSGQES